jgi:hypothetical protein
MSAPLFPGLSQELIYIFQCFFEPRVIQFDKKRRGFYTFGENVTEDIIGQQDPVGWILLSVHFYTDGISLDACNDVVHGTLSPSSTPSPTRNSDRRSPIW